MAITQALQDTTVDLVLAGHTHRIANFMVGHIPVAEGLNAGASYSVAQLMVKGGDVEWVGAATRVAKNLGVAKRADVQAIVDDANAKTAVLRNQVIGTQQFDIKRAPTRLFESAMGNMVADAMRLKYPGVDAAYTNSGGLRADLNCAPAERRRAELRDHLGRDVRGAAVRQPDRHRDPDRRPARAGLPERLLAGLQRRHRARVASRRSPASRRPSAATGRPRSSPGMWKTPQGINGPATPIGPADTVRFVTNDFMYTGGDGYTVFSQGTERPAARRRPAPGRHRLRHGQLAGGTGRGRPHRRSMSPIVGP